MLELLAETLHNERRAAVAAARRERDILAFIRRQPAPGRLGPVQTPAPGRLAQPRLSAR